MKNVLGHEVEENLKHQNLVVTLNSRYHNYGTWPERAAQAMGIFGKALRFPYECNGSRTGKSD